MRQRVCRGVAGAGAGVADVVGEDVHAEGRGAIFRRKEEEEEKKEELWQMCVSAIVFFFSKKSFHTADWHVDRLRREVEVLPAVPAGDVDRRGAVAVAGHGWTGGGWGRGAA